MGRENTEETLSIAGKRADELGIKTILVASTVGDTAVRAVDVFKGMKVVVVTHAAGFRAPNFQEFTEENRRIVESKGGVILTTKHAFLGLTRQWPPSPGAPPPPPPAGEMGEIVANTLRMFSQEVKVVAEIAVMAADSGLVRTDEDVIVVSGTGRGADTAAVVRPANSRDLFRLRIKELLCKPHFPAAPQGPAAAPGGTVAAGSPPPRPA